MTDPAETMQASAQAAPQAPATAAGTAHWAAPYIGEPWTTEHDCWAFVRRVWAEEFGWEVPELGLQARQHHPANYARLAGALEHDLAWLPIRMAQATDGDAVVMGRGTVATHIGLCVLADGRRRVLHCLRGVGVVCEVGDDLWRHHLQVLRCWRHPSRADDVAPSDRPAGG